MCFTVIAGRKNNNTGSSMCTNFFPIWMQCENRRFGNEIRFFLYKYWNTKKSSDRVHVIVTNRKFECVKTKLKNQQWNKNQIMPRDITCFWENIIAQIHIQLKAMNKKWLHRWIEIFIDSYLFISSSTNRLFVDRRNKHQTLYENKIASGIQEEKKN